MDEEVEAAGPPPSVEWFEQEWWDDRYATAHGRVFSGHVNAQLAREAVDLTPGRALDVGAGDGGDALWLAGRGWEVTGLDFSPVALRRAAEQAAVEGVGHRTAWHQADVRTWEHGEQRWDLVTSHFLHLPDGGMQSVVRRLASAVAPGGTLLVVGHHPDDLATGLRHGRPEWLFTPEDLLPALDPEQFELEVAEVRSRTESHDDQPAVTVRDSVVRARRRS